MAERLGVASQKLQPFITDSPWAVQPVWDAIRREVVGSLAPLVAWMVDETGWLKPGLHSVGVAPQYCGAVGKSANCQVNVQVAVTEGQVTVPVGARLYLPERWTQDRARGQAAGVPDTLGLATQPQIALERLGLMPFGIRTSTRQNFPCTFNVNDYLRWGCESTLRQRTLISRRQHQETSPLLRDHRKLRRLCTPTTAAVSKKRLRH